MQHPVLSSKPWPGVMPLTNKYGNDFLKLADFVWAVSCPDLKSVTPNKKRDLENSFLTR